MQVYKDLHKPADGDSVHSDYFFSVLAKHFTNKDKMMKKKAISDYNNYLEIISADLEIKQARETNSLYDFIDSKNNLSVWSTYS